ncbi:MAG: ABC transporter substrate-binding protein [Rhodospirillales bacterium]|nr:ABC transporter substrate-binding protein [Rhodospirillales bacterium]MBT5351118.1 ABC transporter substrate-binding protein [Rhodospirillales bacterium]MBT6109081.1 ABC transporter substrate-binding protein [Rhodospirillales bacterium]MBT7145580.1 ABC transporter substrate-binding protein [Rhodospirillales bacterium]MBT7778221.1 ABC transporter substrate-binding protein [Rhodospirillales bacterium]
MLKLATCAVALLVAGTISSANAGDTLTIGLATGQTGGLAPYDGPAIEGFQIAVDEINGAGGIGGNIMIKMISKDTRSDAAQTSIAAQELLEMGIDILVTPSDADPAFAAAALATDAKVPAFSPAASSPTLPLMGGDFMFANFPGDNVQATVSAEWAYGEGFRNAYILYSPDTQYTTLPLYFSDVWKVLGGTVAGEGTYVMGQQDFSAEVTKIKALNPPVDVIMTAAYEPDFPAFIRQLRSAGVTAQVIGSDGIDSPTTFSLGDAGDGVVFSTAGHALPGSALEEFNNKFKATYGRDADTIFAAIGYDLMKVIEAGVLAAGSTDSVAIRDAVANLENVQGVTSVITYKGTTGMPVRQVSLIRVKGGDRELVAQPSPTASLVPAPRMQ